MDLRRRRPNGEPGARAAGFSAVEMLTVVAIMGIILLFTMPAFLDFFNAMKVRTAAQRMVSHSRLCRQIAVSRRTDVVMEFQVGDADGDPTSTYRAWEDYDADLGKDTDESWVVRPDVQLKIDHIKLKAVYNDTSPQTANEQFDDAAVIHDEDGKTVLRFKSNGEVVRVSEGVEQTGDTLMRIRLDGIVGGDRIDRWYVNLNRAGKADTDRIVNPAWS